MTKAPSSTAAKVSVLIAAAAGIVLGLSVDSSGVAKVLHVAGYPTALVVIARFVPVVRQRCAGWFAAHEAGMAAITAGHALEGRTAGVVVNGAWLVGAALWYLRFGPR